MRILAIIIAATVGVTLPQASDAQDFDRGVSAYNDGDYPTALREFRLAAERGDALAQPECARKSQASAFIRTAPPLTRPPGGVKGR